jgi:cytidylate kinase
MSILNNSAEAADMLSFKDEIPMEQIISRQIRLWERTYDSGKLRRGEQDLPCVTISKEIGSQGVELAHRLASRLHWQVFDKELVEYIANNAHVRRNVVELFDQKTQSEIETWVRTLLDRHALASDKYFKHLISVITTIGEHGRAVVLGRGANFILPPEKALRLKIVAPLENRIDYTVKQLGVSKKEAKKIVSQADKERSAFIRRFFHHKAEDPLNYDLVLNLGSLDLKVAEEIALQALKAKFSGSAW